MEEWLPLYEYPGYSVGSEGNVRNDRTDALMKTSINQMGHLMVGLWVDGKQIKRSIGKLVGAYFLDRPENGNFDTVIHLNGALADCRVINLIYRPRWFAVRYHQQFFAEHHDLPTFVVRRTGEVVGDAWSYCIREGLLYRSLMTAIVNGRAIFPTWESFDLLDTKSQENRRL